MKNNKLLIFFITVISITTIVLIVLLGIALLRNNKKPYEKEESTSIIVNEKTMDFLSVITSKSGDSYYNIIESYNKSDEEVFTGIINYLYANNIYTTKNNKYVFKQSDINKYAELYLMKEDFNYITTNKDIEYDSKNKEFSIDTNYKFLDEEAILFNSIDIYQKTEDTVYVLFDIDGSYISSGKKIKKRYDITIKYNNDDFKIVNISN